MDAPTNISAGSAHARPPAVAMVSVAVRGLTSAAGLPGAGMLLRVCAFDAKYWFLPNAAKPSPRVYRGVPAMELTDNPAGRPVGVVWTRQPAQTLARRGIALVCVVTGGLVTVTADYHRRAPGAPAVMAAADDSAQWLVGYWPSPSRLVIDANPTTWLRRNDGKAILQGFNVPAPVIESDGAFALFDGAYRPVLLELFLDTYAAQAPAEQADFDAKINGARERVAAAVVGGLDAAAGPPPGKGLLRPLAAPIEEPMGTWYRTARDAVEAFIVNTVDYAKIAR